MEAGTLAVAMTVADWRVALRRGLEHAERSGQRPALDCLHVTAARGRVTVESSDAFRICRASYAADVAGSGELSIPGGLAADCAYTLRRGRATTDVARLIYDKPTGAIRWERERSGVTAAADRCAGAGLPGTYPNVALLLRNEVQAPYGQWALALKIDVAALIPRLRPGAGYKAAFEPYYRERRRGGLCELSGADSALAHYGTRADGVTALPAPVWQRKPDYRVTFEARGLLQALTALTGYRGATKRRPLPLVTIQQRGQRGEEAPGGAPVMFSAPGCTVVLMPQYRDADHGPIGRHYVSPEHDAMQAAQRDSEYAAAQVEQWAATGNVYEQEKAASEHGRAQALLDSASRAALTAARDLHAVYALTG